MKEGSVYPDVGPNEYLSRRRESSELSGLVARGFVGPARWINTPSSVTLPKNTITMSPGVFIGTPDDMATVPKKPIMNEINGINAVCEGSQEKALMAWRRVRTTIRGMPSVQELADNLPTRMDDSRH